HAVFSDRVALFANRIREPGRLNFAIGDCQDALFFGAVIERAEGANFFQSAHSVESVEVLSVTGGELGRFEIAAAQIVIVESFRTISGEQMKAQPAAIGARNALGFSEKRDEQKEHKISVHLSLQLQITRKIFGTNLARAAFKLERGMERVIDLFHEHDERPDIVIA